MTGPADTSRCRYPETKSTLYLLNRSPRKAPTSPTMLAGGSTMTEHIQGLSQSGFAEFGTHLVVGPMYHTGPLSGMRLFTLGIPSVILGRFDAETTLATIEKYKTEPAHGVDPLCENAGIT